MTFISRIFRSRPNAGLTYSLQREYPFRFFTTFIVALLFVLLVIFTTFNIATNGYSMQYIVTDAPNATLSQRRWFQNPIFTFGDDKFDPKCLSNDLAIGTPFVTTNKGNAYVLSNIWDAEGRQRTSFPYLNNGLENCKVESIDIFLEKSDQSAHGNDNWWSWGYSYAQLGSICNVTTSGGEFKLDIRALYTATSKSYGRLLQISQLDLKPSPWTHASQWWGTRMQRLYWQGLLTLMAKGNGSSTPIISGGTFTYAVNGDAPSLAEDVAFDSKYTFVLSNGNNDFAPSKKSPSIQFFNNVNFAWSRAMTEGLSFAKVFYSLVLIDLGNTNAPNLLSTDESLKAALQSPYNFNRGPDGPLCNKDYNGQWTQACIMGALGERPLMADAYDVFRNQTGSLGSSSSTISAQYTCSIPTRKSMVTVFWTTILANFVLLQVAYSIAMFIATELVSRRDPTAMYCDGCRPKQPPYPHKMLALHPEDDTQSLINHPAASREMEALRQLPPSVRPKSSEYTLLRRRQSVGP